MGINEETKARIIKWLVWGHIMSFPGGSDSKESACNEGDLSSIPGSGEVNGNPP